MKKYLFLIAAAAFALYACGQKEPDVTPDVSVNPTELNAVAAGETLELTVTSNTDWALNTSANWISFEPAKGNGNGKVSVTVAENTSTKERTDKVTISCSAKRVTVNVKQAAAEKPEVQKVTSIKTAEDFVAFANSEYEATETVTLDANITISEPAPVLTCIFDGKGNTITLNLEDKTGCTAESPELADIGIFRKVSGKVKDLKTAGSISNSSEGLEYTYHIGGIAGYATETAVFENCTNGINLFADKFNTHHLGGIVGFTEPGVTLTGCKNTGKIETYYTETSGAKASQLGGIIGHLEGSGVVTSCTNEGEISYFGAGTVRMGGIVGYVNYAVSATFKDCSNSGALKNDATGYSSTKWSYQGGIVGYYGTPNDNSAILYENCSNSGAISTNAAGTKLRVRIGGIAGILGNAAAVTEYKNCSNSGDLTLTNGSAGRVQLGGIIGYAEKAGTFSIKDCSNSGSISSDGKGSVATDGIAGIVGSGGDASSSFTNVTVAPSTKLTMAADGIARLIVVGDVPYKTAVTGKVAGTITVGEAPVEITADNYSSWLFCAALGESGSASGVTFGN